MSFPIIKMTRRQARDAQNCETRQDYFRYSSCTIIIGGEGWERPGQCSTWTWLGQKLFFGVIFMSTQPYITCIRVFPRIPRRYMAGPQLHKVYVHVHVLLKQHCRILMCVHVHVHVYTCIYMQVKTIPSAVAHSDYC